MPTNKFENSSIVVGQIKELLHSFNLPMIPVYTDEIKLQDDRPYIKDNYVVRYKDGEFKKLMPYKFGLEIINLTKNFQIRSSIYDSYTHNYLGDYLRFLRDFKHLDLMNFYNCFFGDELANEYLSLDKITIDTTDEKYKYYIIPIKLDEVYTIAIDAMCSYELALLMYNDNLVDTDECKELIEQTYTKIKGSSFKRPYLFETKVADKFYAKEHDIKLFIKLPKKINSSIVVLEGNYTVQAESVDGISFSGESKNSLLQINNNTSYPFSDRLIEYLTDNVICPLDQIPENIQRVQDSVYIPELHYIKGVYGSWDNDLKEAILNSYNKKDATLGNGVRKSNTITIIDHDGTTTSREYEYRFIDTKVDLNGYVDKDTEQLLNVEYNNYLRGLE